LQVKYADLHIQKRIDKFLRLLKVIRFNPVALAPYFGLTDSVRLRLRPIDLHLYADKLLLESLIKFSKLLDGGVRLHHLHKRHVCLDIPWIKALSPPLLVEDAIKLSGFLLYLEQLLKLGATLNPAKSIISLDFYPKSPRFKIDIWSDVHEALYIYYAERLLGKLLARNNVVLKDATVIDIGGYIGDTAIFFALEGAKKVFSFEPHPMLFDLLKTNISLNSLEKTIIPYRLAIGGNRKVVPLRVPSGKHSEYKTLGITTSGSGSIICYAQQIAFEEILTKFSKVDIVKFNCEGCEYSSILSSSVESLNKIKYLILHLHQHNAGLRLALLKWLKKAGFKLLECYGPEHYLFGLC
jgi:FkbM family methyltransferase